MTLSASSSANPLDVLAAAAPFEKALLTLTGTLAARDSKRPASLVVTSNKRLWLVFDHGSRPVPLTMRTVLANSKPAAIALRLGLRRALFAPDNPEEAARLLAVLKDAFGERKLQPGPVVTSVLVAFMFYYWANGDSPWLFATADVLLLAIGVGFLLTPLRSRLAVTRIPVPYLRSRTSIMCWAIAVTAAAFQFVSSVDRIVHNIRFQIQMAQQRRRDEAAEAARDAEAKRLEEQQRAEQEAADRKLEKQRRDTLEQIKEASSGLKIATAQGVTIEAMGALQNASAALLAARTTGVPADGATMLADLQDMVAITAAKFVTLKEISTIPPDISQAFRGFVIEVAVSEAAKNEFEALWLPIMLGEVRKVEDDAAALRRTDLSAAKSKLEEGLTLLSTARERHPASVDAIDRQLERLRSRLGVVDDALAKENASNELAALRDSVAPRTFVDVSADALYNSVINALNWEEVWGTRFEGRWVRWRMKFKENGLLMGFYATAGSSIDIDCDLAGSSSDESAAIPSVFELHKRLYGRKHWENLVVEGRLTNFSKPAFQLRAQVKLDDCIVIQ